MASLMIPAEKRRKYLSFESWHFDENILLRIFRKFHNDINLFAKKNGNTKFTNNLQVSEYLSNLLIYDYLADWERSYETIRSFLALGDGLCIDNTPTSCEEYEHKVVLINKCTFCQVRKILICYRELLELESAVFSKNGKSFYTIKDFSSSKVILKKELLALKEILFFHTKDIEAYVI